MSNKVAAAPERGDLTVNAFCRQKHMSRSAFYAFDQAGKGPRCYWVGAERRITQQAADDWTRDREAEAKDRPPSKVGGNRRKAAAVNASPQT